MTATPHNSLTDLPDAPGSQNRSMRREPGRPLRILFAVYTPWTERLGVPRVSIELSRHLEQLGHKCEKFSLEDAGIVSNKLTAPFTIARFQRRLLRFIQEYGCDYDIIQAECMVLPFARKSYKYNGCLISKSNGLPHLYYQYLNKSVLPQLQRQAGERGTPWGNAIRAIGKRFAGGFEGVRRSFETADKVHLLNREEWTFVRDELGFGDKCELVPNGLSEERAAALASTATPLQRTQSNTVVFIGTWSLRKGKQEFPAIVRQVRAQRPMTRFRLIGTNADASTILAHFDQQDRANVDIVSTYDPDQLPSLLGDAKCGVFPSYIEGFPLGVLEMLAAGIPVVAWKVPGPCEMLREAPGTLVKPGDVEETGRRLLAKLESPNIAAELMRCQAISRRFCWRQIAEQFLRAVPDSCV